MKFRTELNIPPSRFSIGHTDGVVLIGSCFSINIGDRLQKYKFTGITHPFGTVYNPVSIARLLDYAAGAGIVDNKNLIFSSGIWVHPDFHSSLGSPDRDRAAEGINGAIVQAGECLRRVKFLFVTLGTSIVYKWKRTGNIVANCHKLPASEFARQTVPAQEGAEALAAAFDQLRKINPAIRIILTVSPVRHVRDGLIENMRSKARLFETVDILCSTFDNVSYFPAYEWMMDDLRDYRFYTQDLIHPNEQAIDYIWEKFCDHYFDEKTRALVKSIGKVLEGLGHRPFNPDTSEHKSFLAKLQEDISRLEQDHPWLKIERE